MKALLAIFFVSNVYAVPPVCFPLIPSDTYRYVTAVRLGDNDTHRWASWDCRKLIEDSTYIRYCLVGSKSISWSSLLGRIGTIEKSTDRQKSAITAWNRYVTLAPTDPLIAAGVAACSTAF